MRICHNAKNIDNHDLRVKPASNDDTMNNASRSLHAMIVSRKVDDTIVYSFLRISITRHSIMIYHGDKIDI